MFPDLAIIIINITNIVFLFIMLLILAAATRMKGGGGWAALIIVTTTVPIYLANTARYFAMENNMLILYPSIFLNVLLMPSLWFFTRSQLDKNFRLTVRSLLHTIPAFISLFSFIVYYAPLTDTQVEAERLLWEAGGDNLPDDINNILLYFQLFTYYPAMFWYIHKRKKELLENFSDSDYLEVKWVMQFIALSFLLFLVVFIAYVISPRSDMWLIPILNSIVMAYLVYCVIRHSTAAYINRLPDMVEKMNDDTVIATEDPASHVSTSSSAAMTPEQMKEICDKVTGYLQTTERYKDKDLSLSTLALEVGAHHKKISTAINGYLHRNFFELVNAMRVEEAKRRLQTLNTGEYTIESIYSACGFQSRSSFFTTFKNIAGASPARWLKNNSNLK